jgi:hypothetical protein
MLTPPQEGWLEIRDAEDGSQHVEDCPRRGEVPLRECLGCKRCEGLAMSPDGKRIYAVCDIAHPRGHEGT